MSVISGILNAGASESAANTQANAATQASQDTLAATKYATDLQERMYQQGRTDTAPWREAGGNALTQLVSKVNAGPGEYTKSPGYQFRLNEGTKAIERSAAARGGLNSGATGKALARYGQDYATGDYQNFLSNYYNSLTPLQSLAGVGQTTASQNAVAGNQTANSIANTTLSGTEASNNYLNSAANANASGTINAANSLTGALNSGVNNYMMWKYLNSTPAAAATTAAPAAASDAWWFEYV
jgi:hypothetical protein